MEALSSLLRKIFTQSSRAAKGYRQQRTILEPIPEMQRSLHAGLPSVLSQSSSPQGHFLTPLLGFLLRNQSQGKADITPPSRVILFGQHRMCEKRH